MLGLYTKPKVGALGFDLSGSLSDLIEDLERVAVGMLVEIKSEADSYGNRVIAVGAKAEREKVDRLDEGKARWGTAFNSLGEIQNFPRIDFLCAQYNAVQEILLYLKEMQTLSQDAPAPVQKPKESKLGLPASKKVSPAKGKKGKKK